MKKKTARKSKPSTGFKKTVAASKVSHSKAIVLVDPTPAQAHKTQRACTSRKTSALDKVGPSPTTFDDIRFRSSNHVKNYHSYVKLRSIIPDHNIILNDDEYPKIRAAIARMGWEFICQIAGQGRQTLTHEFYTQWMES
ncbi:hypothetical protein SESBI_06886 [Sesbania bispinosa]|nr:hypothetical protein SESBI_06886 [Sesbania bispinosa]